MNGGMCKHNKILNQLVLAIKREFARVCCTHTVEECQN